MNKQEFLDSLRRELGGLPTEDIEERIAFYSEMIDDKIEEGLSEEEAVSTLGAPQDIAKQIIASTPLIKLAKERIKSKRDIKAWEIVLLALGSPIWFSLLIAAASVIFSVYVVLWSVIIVLWSVFVSFAASSFGCMVASAVFAFTDNVLPGIAVFAAGLCLAGLSIFTFYGCKAATKGMLCLTKKIAVWIKGCFIKKEVAR